MANLSVSPREFLEAPRARRLLFELACDSSREFGKLSYRYYRALSHLRGDAIGYFFTEKLSDEEFEVANNQVKAEIIADQPSLEDVIAAVPSEAVFDYPQLLSAMEATVDAARYWQELDAEEVFMEEPEVQVAFLPFATSVLSHPLTRHWQDAPKPPTRHFTYRNGIELHNPKWRTEDISAAQVSPDVTSGVWWSTPPAPLETHNSTVPEEIWQEDSYELAENLYEVSVEKLRVYVINRPEDWQRLVAEHPLEVTNLHAYDWPRTAGFASRWFEPSWGEVARPVDAIHVTQIGYLLTGGRALEVREGHTVMAGFAPDRTWWLNAEGLHFMLLSE